MAQGGDLIDFNDPDYGNDDEQEVDTTWHFQPPESSTPYHGGEQHEMQTMMYEQSGLPYGEETTPLLGPQVEAQNSWDALTRLFPRASPIDLETSYNSKSGRLEVKKSGFGKKSYPLFTKDYRTGQDRLNSQLTKKIKAALGEPAEEIIAEDRDSIREQRQRLAEAEQQQRQAEALAAERENNAQEMQTLGQQIERTQARIDALQEEHGSNLESEAELNRLKLLKKKL